MTVFKARGALHPEEDRDIIVPRIEADDIISNIKDKHEYIVIQAPSQSGKTTILYQIYSHLHGHGYGVVYLDLSILRNQKEILFYKYLYLKIEEGLKDVVDDNFEGVNACKIASGLEFFESLTQISKSSTRIRKIIFLIDEIGDLSDELVSSFFPGIRNIFSNGSGISSDRELFSKFIFVFAGDHDLEKLIRGQNSPLRDVCKHFELKDFTQDQVRFLAKNLISIPQDCTDYIADNIFGLSSGHPYFTQRIFSLIDESQDHRNTSSENIANIVYQIVNTKILYGHDANLAHIFHYLQHKGHSHCKAVADILYNNSEQLITSAPHDRELLLTGIIKRSSNLNLSIRNNIYIEALKLFFNKESRTIPKE